MKRKPTIQERHNEKADYPVHDPPLDALIAITKRLGLNEGKYHIESEEFYYRYQKGEMGDDLEFMEWARDYRDCLNLRQRITDQLRDVA